MYDVILKKSKKLNVLKLLSAIIIVIFHYNKFTGTLHCDTNFPFYKLLKIFYNYGGNFVELFFIISGFTFFAVYSKKIENGEISSKEFAVKRISRLFPLYWFTTFSIICVRTLCYCMYGVKLSGGGTMIIQL